MTEIRLSSLPERLVVAHHNGPGLRGIVWVQGCSLLCTRECLNPHLLSQSGGVVVDVAVLTEALERAARAYAELEGFTILGGEPFDQAQAIAEAVEPLRARGYSIMVYSGHTLEELHAANDPGYERLLAATDVLVDGPYLAPLHDESLIWRGSSNQRILRLSGRYSEADLEAAIRDQRRAMYVSFNAGRGDYVVAGAQSRDAAAKLRSIRRTDGHRQK